MNAERIFSEITSFFYDETSLEEAKKDWPWFNEFINKGYSPEVIYLVTKLWMCIYFFHIKVFGFEKPLIPEFIYGGNPDEWCAHYCKDDDNYAIYLDHFDEGIKDKSYLILYPDGGSFEIKEDAKNSIENSLICIAAHEVRHRLQFKNDFPLFSMGNSENINEVPILSEYAYYCEECLFPEIEKSLRKKGKPEEYIRSRTDKLELDANIIEYTVASKIHRGADIDEIIEIIKLTPNGSSS